MERFQQTPGILEFAHFSAPNNLSSPLALPLGKLYVAGMQYRKFNVDAPRPCRK